MAVKIDYSLFTMKLTKILPNLTDANRNGYFSYWGSLTTPPCNENIPWMVYRTNVNISVKQVRLFI